MIFAWSVDKACPDTGAHIRPLTMAGVASQQRTVVHEPEQTGKARAQNTIIL